MRAFLISAAVMPGNLIKYIQHITSLALIHQRLCTDGFSDSENGWPLGASSRNGRFFSRGVTPRASTSRVVQRELLSTLSRPWKMIGNSLQTTPCLESPKKL